MNNSKNKYKSILGLDLGVGSIGYALVKESQDKELPSEIVKMGVRVVPLSVDEKNNYEKGSPITTNAERTLKRSMRRNLQRYKQRRNNLRELLIENGFISEQTPLTEIGKNTTHTLLRLRAKAANEKIELEEFARVLLAINKKRGYKSSRTVVEEEGVAIDGLAVSKFLSENNMTPGQYGVKILKEGKKNMPDFYPSDLKKEFDAIWDEQIKYYPEILTNELYEKVYGKNKKQTWAILAEPFGLEGIKLEEKGIKLKEKLYSLRSDALYNKLDLEYLVLVLQEINGDVNKSSGYLGLISDRSKELYFNNLTVGEYQWKKINANPNYSLKNQVFYRQDYIDEFEKIWKTQSAFYPDRLTEDLKKQIRDTIIFYQRKLKSQKSLISLCEFESWETDKKDEKGNIIIDEDTGLPVKKIVGRRVIPKSSPLFQEFKILQTINNLKLISLNDELNEDERYLDENQREILFQELSIRKKLSQKEIFKLLGINSKEWKINFANGLDGNIFNAKLYEIYTAILENEGYDIDWNKKSAIEIKAQVRDIFKQIGIDDTILDFDSSLSDKKEFENQSLFQLWHLLYSAQDDDNVTEEDRIKYGNSLVNLKKQLETKFHFPVEYAKLLANMSLPIDYGSLCSKAIKKILPFLHEGKEYSEACLCAGYNHSNSLTKEELEKRDLANKLKILPKNSLRNPVVEKILNQMINVVNNIIDVYGKPDEVRIELARELKQNAKDRSETEKSINNAKKENEKNKKILIEEYGFKYPTKTDVTRYKLWQELSKIGYKDIYTGREIKPQEIFSSSVDIEHIIPKALLYDDSFSNKTLSFKDINIKKGSRTAMDFMTQDYGNKVDDYKNRVQDLFKKGAISKAKYKKLLMSYGDLPKNFIERDLRETQYITKKAKELLFNVVKDVVVTTGSITDKLRQDWGLIDIMKELSFSKYKALGLTEMQERLDIGQDSTKQVEVIKNWTKRNDHRHHAMDALTVAFTKRSYIQYFNTASAKNDNIVRGCFVPPMSDFRTQAKKHIEDILISIKAKNKVVTINKNHISAVKKPQIVLTPRDQLHDEKIYGRIKMPMQSASKLNKNFSVEQAAMIIDLIKRKLVLAHLAKYDNKSEVAFNTKTLKKDPIILNGEPLKEVLCFKYVFTINEAITKDLKIEKVIDTRIREILKQRLEDYNNEPQEAFTNLDENPIWLNKEKGICIKRVKIRSFFQTLNNKYIDIKRDHLGNPILDKDKNKIPNRYVNYGNNHHVAVYKDKNDDIQVSVITFMEAVQRKNKNLPVIDEDYNKDNGWQFLFTIKENEMFVFPNEDFNIDEIDLLNSDNNQLISKHLYRVQKISKGEYVFRHHLETTVNEDKALKDIAYIIIRSAENLRNLKKVRIDHLGRIVSVGEY